MSSFILKHISNSYNNGIRGLHDRQTPCRKVHFHVKDCCFAVSYQQSQKIKNLFKITQPRAGLKSPKRVETQAVATLLQVKIAGYCANLKLSYWFNL